MVGCPVLIKVSIIFPRRFADSVGPQNTTNYLYIMGGANGTQTQATMQITIIVLELMQDFLWPPVIAQLSVQHFPRVFPAVLVDQYGDGVSWPAWY